MPFTNSKIYPCPFEESIESDIFKTEPVSFNVAKQVNGFQGFIAHQSSGDPGALFKIKDPYGMRLGTSYTNEYGHYKFAYNQIKNRRTLNCEVPGLPATIKVMRE